MSEKNFVKKIIMRRSRTK